jgi:hypothetical protein
VPVEVELMNSKEGTTGARDMDDRDGPLTRENSTERFSAWHSCPAHIETKNTVLHFKTIYANLVYISSVVVE